MTEGSPARRLGEALEIWLERLSLPDGGTQTVPGNAVRVVERIGRMRFAKRSQGLVPVRHGAASIRPPSTTISVPVM